ncbi:hypothetical protein GOBAR_DD18885 [Gossypium barbadense]|nr:hypothetical protein GOBAR_DD18885 [Gossypium barbadense]
MEFLDDNNVKTMVALYCQLGRLDTEPIQLFAKLAYAKPIENVTQLSQQYGVEDLRAEFPKSSVHGFDIDLNVRCSYQYVGGLQIHLVVIETNVLCEDGSNNNDCFDYKGEDFGDPDLNDTSDDIDDEGLDDRNDHALLVENPSHGIVIRPICRSSILMRRMLLSSLSTWTSYLLA